MSETLVKFVMKFTLYCNGPGSTLTIPNNLKRKNKYLSQQTGQLRMGTKLPSEISFTVEILSAGTHVMRVLDYQIFRIIRQYTDLCSYS
jgi:hypothetical protein